MARVSSDGCWPPRRPQLIDFSPAADEQPNRNSEARGRHTDRCGSRPPGWATDPRQCTGVRETARSFTRARPSRGVSDTHLLFSVRLPGMAASEPGQLRRPGGFSGPFRYHAAVNVGSPAGTRGIAKSRSRRSDPAMPGGSRYRGNRCRRSPQTSFLRGSVGHAAWLPKPTGPGK